ncbi:hypothetical protein DERP_001429 [Dermatophagoides pteronyssinus]|uniref:Secreted protein n=1 Tax=Dermatophagoides pteronyssinus TaxID=6956 RepID=A0ABQ8JEF7_DERPT|nr:hypothetical protein DERP_001429 [Dermatophagoides pteronyssinus]
MTSSNFLSTISLISAPAANAFSEPVNTIAAILLSFSNCCIASTTSSMRPPQRAFNAFGRFNVTRPTFCLAPFNSTS